MKDREAAGAAGRSGGREGRIAIPAARGGRRRGLLINPFPSRRVWWSAKRSERQPTPGALTPRNWGQSLLACIGELNRYIKGWVAYYRLCNEEAVRNWKATDAHVRRRLRVIVMRQKKRPRYLYRHLLNRGVAARKAAQTAWSSRGIWHRSAHPGMHLGYRIDWFTEHLVSLTTEWYRHNLPNLVPSVLDPQLNLSVPEIPTKEPDA